MVERSCSEYRLYIDNYLTLLKIIVKFQQMIRDHSLSFVNSEQLSPLQINKNM